MTPRPRVLHIIGSKSNVSIASTEIHQFAFNNQLGSKIIDHSDFLQELKKDVQRDVYIHSCNHLSCEQIKKVHNSIYFRFFQKPIFSYAIYVNQPLFFCPYIDCVYSLENTNNDKSKLLYNLFFNENVIRDSKYYYKR